MKTRTNAFLLFLAACITFLILIGGYLYYRDQKLIIRKEKTEILKGIALLKIDQIKSWRLERVADANTFYRNSIFEKSVEKIFENNKNQELKKDILEHLTTVKTQSGYENIFLTSGSGRVIISVDPTVTAIDTLLSSSLAEASNKKKVIFTDLYYCSFHEKIHYDIIVPIIDSREKTIANIVMRLDPNQYLYQLFQSWPVPSNSSEILIVRKSGDSVIYLNELRFLNHTALTLKFPISRKSLPAVQAVLGYDGVWEGKDYRNIDVLAYLCKVPGTSWIMVAKVDKKEIFSELNYRAIIISLVMIILIILTTVTISLYQYSRQRTIYKQLFLKERLLTDTQEEYGTMLYSIGDGVITADPEGIIRHMNPVAAALTGWSESDAKQKNLEKVFHLVNETTRAKVETSLADCLKGKVTILIPDGTLLISSEGNETPIEGNIAPIIVNDLLPAGVVIVFKDQTTKRKEEEKLKKSNAELERSNKELEQFAYVASHDLQEPLRMVASFTQLLYKRYSNQMGKDADEFIMYIVDGANRMQRLIQDLLTYSRINTQGNIISEVDSHKALGEALSNLRVSIRESGAMITNEDLPVIKADYGQLVQVFQNLISNSIKFHGPAPPLIHVSAVMKETEWIFTVRDNGIGIEEQYFKRIFLIFQRLHAGTEYPGTGIGLAICNRIVHRHGGRIWVNSEPGKGSVFNFTVKC